MIFSGWIWFSVIAVLSASSLAVTTISRTAAAVAMSISCNIDDSQGGLPAALPSSGMS
jgi:hypothetical protein